MAVIVGMKHLISIFIIFWICVFPALSRTLTEDFIATTYEQWMAKHQCTYANDALEKAKRFKIFMENYMYVENFNNARNKSYKLALNQFADLTAEEFIALYTGFKISSLPRSSKKATFRPLSLDDVPESMDWRKKGVVTPIKNQGQCGSCWAFSAVAAVEGITKIKTGKLPSLSEQHLVDCPRHGGNRGCSGGWMDNGFQYIINNKGIASEADYPYQGTDGTCRNRSKGFPAARISGYEDVPANSEEQLLQAVINQPVSVAISVDTDFHMYGGGVFTGGCGISLNHAVTIIGYGTSIDGTKYWLVKNSWGESWGENGYMKLLRDSDSPEGLCGIAMRASYPTI
ncbi:hypothetical protein L6164_036828 [Bauhinia variegata]|uniref:Uncharacterized protein n=1 Tax=Bauhinia variegata TaxID=167791 RepID=A0ACB9KI75_BAUVA|nr:hypothetical protein L6164_036828 [Bauhinia variegata]